MEKVLEYVDEKWDDLSHHTPNDEELRIGLPNPFISPSNGVFNADQFYWDSYFIIVGLITAGKIDLAKGMVDNFVYLFKKYKVIPSRNRLYNLGGSQPPLLTSMAGTIYEKTGDWNWYCEVMEIAEKELNSYWLDAKKLETHALKNGLVRYCDHYLNHVTSEHESGWDMTSRFHERCMNFAPVDLNCLIYKYEKDLSCYYKKAKNLKKALDYEDRAEKRKTLINKYMWDKDKKFYFDYNVKYRKLNDFYSLAGFFPLWVGLADKTKAKAMLESLKYFDFPGGLVTTRKESIEGKAWQWDYPNVWAPLELIVVEGLLNYGYVQEARDLAKKWVDLVTRIFHKTGKIYEKYNAVDGTLPKGERYENQEGFGWTNAVFLKFIEIFDFDLQEQKIETIPKRRELFNLNQLKEFFLEKLK